MRIQPALRFSAGCIPFGCSCQLAIQGVIQPSRRDVIVELRSGETISNGAFPGRLLRSLRPLAMTWSSWVEDTSKAILERTQ